MVHTLNQHITRTRRPGRWFEHLSIKDPNLKNPIMHSHEPKNKKFIALILFMVLAVASAKVIHDLTVFDTNQTQSELIAKKEVKFKK